MRAIRFLVVTALIAVTWNPGFAREAEQNWQPHHRVELTRGKWYQLTADEWRKWNDLRTLLDVVQKLRQKGGVTHKDRESLEQRRHELEWEFDQHRLTLLKARVEAHPYYPGYPESHDLCRHHESHELHEHRERIEHDREHHERAKRGNAP